MKVRGQVVHPLKERLARMSKVDAETGCREWTGSRRNGYGRLTVGSRRDGTRRTVSAHRLAYELRHGPAPEGMEVCHACDNRACVNPSHLFIGTRQDNIDDREAKGRNRPPRGEKHGQAKLTASDVVAARDLRSGGASYRQLAARFGVEKRTIYDAVTGKNWKHLPSSPEAP